MYVKDANGCLMINNKTDSFCTETNWPSQCYHPDIILCHKSKVPDSCFYDLDCPCHYSIINQPVQCGSSDPTCKIVHALQPCFDALDIPCDGPDKDLYWQCARNALGKECNTLNPTQNCANYYNKPCYGDLWYLYWQCYIDNEECNSPTPPYFCYEIMNKECSHPDRPEYCDDVILPPEYVEKNSISIDFIIMSLFIVTLILILVFFLWRRHKRIEKTS